VVTKDNSGFNWTVEEMVPVVESVHNREHFLVINVVIALVGSHLAGEELDRSHTILKTLC
jgi:hypothetical protein